MEITLYHNRNWKSFKRHFPNAKFLGFGCGYYEPSFRVDDQEWETNKSKLPKSCTVIEIKADAANKPLNPTTKSVVGCLELDF